MVFTNKLFAIILSVILSIVSSTIAPSSAHPADASDIAIKLDALHELGIAFSEETALLIGQSIDETKSRLADFGFDDAQFSSYPIILSMLGTGKYDEATQQLIPLTNDVYAFDAECYDIEGAYEGFLRAVSRISNGEIRIDNCQSDVSETTLESGIGTQQVAFRLNDKSYDFTAQFYYDWMDCTLIDYVNSILEAQGIDKRLWCMFDGGQGFVVFYNTAEWAQAFWERTGYPLAQGAADAL